MFSFHPPVLYHCYNFVKHSLLCVSHLIFSLSLFLAHESCLSSVSLICSVVVAIISLTLVLLNLIPLSLFSSVYNFSPLIFFFPSSSFFGCLWAPQGLFLVWFHPSFSTWRSQSPKVPGGHTLHHTPTLRVLSNTRTSYVHTRN